jgi:HPt (histidine-containing phosphotransfer) domain-containing protein
MDPERLTRLLEIAGPEDSSELLRRLSGDLTRVRDNIVAALNNADIAALRAETHVLISLAGAVGAERLHQLAKHMNADVHRQDTVSLRASGREAQRLIDLVLDLIERESARRNPAT